MQKNSAPESATSLSRHSIESLARFPSAIQSRNDLPSLSIGDTNVRQDIDGRYCLNDLHRVAGGARRQSPSLWLVNQQTKELVQELSDTGIPVSVVRGGPRQGTYVTKELVYAYATWISPSFHLRVIRAYDAMMIAPPVTDPMQLFNDPVAMRHVALTYAERLIEQAPKVAALERIVAAAGEMCITNAAKVLHIRPAKLFGWLSENRWIYRRPGSRWIAYQPRLQSGHLRHKISTFERSDGTERVVEQVMVTSKGLGRLAELLSSCPGGAQ